MAKVNTYSPRGWLATRYGNDIALGFERTGTPSHDKVGNVTQLVDSYLGTIEYTFYHLDRLTSFSNPYSGVNYGFDPWGNLTTHTVTTGTGYNFSLNYGVNNQVTPAGSTNGGLTYDASGDVLFDGLNNYGYDGEGRVLTVNGYTTYLYGPDGTRGATSQDGSVSAEYLYD
jgi:hypothetical protein